MRMKPRVILASAVVLAMVSASDAMAGTRNGVNSFNFGNKQAGAKGEYRINTENRKGYSRAAVTAKGDVMLLNKTAKGVEFTATVENSSGKKTANYSLKIAGYLVDSVTKTASFTWNKPVNRTLLQASAPFTVGPVPVTVSGSVGGNANIGYTFELNSSGVALSGNASASAIGSASAGAGVSVLNLSLRSDLQLAKTSLNPSVRVTPTTMTGQANLIFDPAKIDFAIVLQTKNKVWWQHNLGSYSAPRKTVTLLQL